MSLTQMFFMLFVMLGMTASYVAGKYEGRKYLEACEQICTEACPLYDPETNRIDRTKLFNMTANQNELAGIISNFNASIPPPNKQTE